MALPISRFYFIPFVDAVNTQFARMHCPGALRLSSSVSAQMLRLCTGATNYFGLGFSKTDPEKSLFEFLFVALLFYITLGELQVTLVNFDSYRFAI